MPPVFTTGDKDDVGFAEVSIKNCPIFLIDESGGVMDTPKFGDVGHIRPRSRDGSAVDMGSVF